MPVHRCNTCNGVYQTVQAENAAYFHACPPEKNPAFQPDPTKGPVVLVETIERANKRDENVDTAEGPNKGKAKRNGTGVTVLVP